LDSSHRADDLALAQAGADRNVVITSGAARALGFDSPQAAVAAAITDGSQQLTIVGIVDDVRFYSPRAPLPPTAFFYRSTFDNPSIGAVRFSGDPRPVLQSLRLASRRIAPQVPFQSITATGNLESYYRADDQAARLFVAGSLFAIAIGCLGLWGLAAFNTSRRVREIGIRKTLGATSSAIVRLLVGQFLRPVLIANLFAWPLAYFALRQWLGGFDDPISLSPLFFIAGSLVALAIAIGTVIAQALRAARAEPAWALRHE
jgi:putative ABC transport system permease protein